MSARDRLYAAIEEPGTYDDPRDIHDLIDDYAHELAEHLRASGYEQAGNFIDPNPSAGPVRPDEERDV